ncbi:MAG: DHH family phosphoesterase [Candidatus Paceibacterales bacterium]
MKIKNLQKVANRILKAIKQKEKIILYGDADLDGVTSIIILKETIKNLGSEITAIYFPDRETEGHGISQKGLSFLKKFSPALFIVLDCGIGNFKEIKLANKIGFEVIVIDHHEVLDKLPEAEIIVDPKQRGDKYPFKKLATAGISFKLSELLLKEKMSQNLRKNFLELVAIATIADMMPQVNENKTFIVGGLKSLERSFRPGIRAFFETDFLKNYNLLQKVSKMISILNVRDVEDNLPISFRLLTLSSFKTAKEIILKLKEKTETRKEEIEKIIEEVKERILRKEGPILFEGDLAWNFSLISPVASNLCQKFKKPVFVFKKLKEESQGTVRTPLRIDSVALMKKCKKYLITYGGHPQASGFRIKNKDLEKFKKCLINHFTRH